ncbi:beta-2 adrenergic receptor-like isoform X1 [Stylophora pistillata]|uniref:beta-2 adrenergic receptor-like isoform X1 n=2 Tax=Stylophora pistillata TaxID=50429 RepID=UPI000C04FAD6|nr:beta-2 adrenergic receptor-like isoform X1 [Stylophora pistillata]
MLPFYILLNASMSPNCPPGFSLADEKDAAMVLVGINIVASILGTLGNLFVLITVCTTQGMVSSFHYFILSLATADLMVALLDQPLLVALIGAHMNFKCLPFVDEAFRAIGNFACAVSLLTLALIALDRCLFVLPSINYKNTMTTGKKIVLAVVWTLACGYAALRLTVDKKITSYLTAAVFGVSYVEMILCYTVVYYQVFKQREFLNASRGRFQTAEQVESLENQAQNITLERRFARTIVMVLFVFTGGWFLLFYLRLTQPEKNYGIMYNTARTVALSASAINPALYCLNNKEYWRAFKRILIKLVCVGSKRKRRVNYERIK